MKKDQKKQFVKNFKESLKNVGILIVTHYSGLKTTLLNSDKEVDFSVTFGEIIVSK